MTTPTAARDVPRPGADSNAKRAAKVADLIVEDVMALGWPVGEVLGSETDLLERYHVSRAVFREAVRLVEHQQVARTRRGPGGGLVISEPTVGAVGDAVVLYLHRVDATLDEIFEARIILEELACELAAERTDESDLAALRRFADGAPIGPGSDPRELHALVAAHQSQCGARAVRRRLQPGGPALFAGLAEARPRRRRGDGARARQDRRGDHGRRRRAGPQPHAQAPAGRGRLLPPPPLDPPTAPRLGRAGRVGGQGRVPRRSPATSPRPSWPRTSNRGTWSGPSPS